MPVVVTVADRLGSLERLGIALVLTLCSCSSATDDAVAPLPDDPGRVPEQPGPPKTPDVVPPAPTPPPAKKNAFFASGHMGRTIMSCDDGLSWIRDHSDNDAARCWVNTDPNNVECDHTPYSGRGLDYQDGVFYASFGWGFNGVARKTVDGTTWTTIKSNGWGGGIVANPSRLFVLWEGNWSTSTDVGASWQQVVGVDPWAFDHATPYRVGNKILVVDRAGKVVISRDGGATFAAPTGAPPTALGSFVEGNGILVSIGSTSVSGSPNVGYVSRSTDDGRSWTTAKVFEAEGQSFTTNVIHTGTQFVTRTGNYAWTSPDGITWTQTKLTLDGQEPATWWGGPTGYNPKTGTYTSFLSAWDSYYDKQRAYRSTDGIAWKTLDTAHFKGGHPLFKIVVGQVEPAVCP